MLIERQEYMEKLIAFRDMQIIKVVTGVRRCGKSTLLEMFQDYLVKDGVREEQIISINFEDLDYAELCDWKNLYAYIKQRLVNGAKTYVFLDEVQNVDDFPKVVDSLYIKKNIDIYITGSNAYMLSGEIATLLSGRYIQIEMLPLSFKEYVSTTGSEDDLPGKYKKYLENSSFPYTLAFEGRQKEIRDYLQGVFNTIVVKDIVNRWKISDPLMLESVLRYLFDNIGNTISTKKIADTMTAEGRKIDVKTIEKYLEAFTESYITYRAGRYDLKGRQHLKTLSKYYVVDIGLRYMLLGSREMDAGRVLENIVYLELKRRGYEIYVGKLENLEVDFIAVEQKDIAYFQVSSTVREERTLERELRSLKAIPDQYPKYILTLDEDPETNYDGIRCVNALEWLMGKIK